MQAHPGQVAVEVFAVLGRLEIAVGDSPVGNRAGDAENDLLDARLALGSSRLAVEILADDDVGGQALQVFGDFAVGLLEEDVAAFILDVRGPLVPFDRLEGVNARRAKLGCDFHGSGPIQRTVKSAAADSRRGPLRKPVQAIRNHSLAVVHRALSCSRGPR